MSTATETLSTESRLTPDRRGTGSSAGSSTTSLARPRIVVVQGAMSVRFSAGSRHRVRALRQVAGRSPAARTTISLPERAEGSSSRCGGRLSERREVSPRIGLLERVLVISGVRGVDLRGTVMSEEGCQRLIEECGVRQRGACLPGARQEILIYRCADSRPSHARIMPHKCHSWPNPSTPSGNGTSPTIVDGSQPKSTRTASVGSGRMDRV